MQTKDSLQTYTIMEKSEAEASPGPGGKPGAGKPEDLYPLFSGFQQPEPILSPKQQPGMDHRLGPGKYGWHMSGPGGGGI